MVIPMMLNTANACAGMIHQSLDMGDRTYSPIWHGKVPITVVIPVPITVAIPVPITVTIPVPITVAIPVPIAMDILGNMHVETSNMKLDQRTMSTAHMMLNIMMAMMYSWMTIIIDV